MRPLLLHPERDVESRGELPAEADASMQDLELARILDAAADGDELVWEVTRHAILDGLADPAAITYRQEAVADCRRSPELIRELYRLAGDAIASERTVFRPLSSDTPTSMAHRSVEVLTLLAGFLQKLRAIADEHASGCESRAFREFFGRVVTELDDAYLARLRAQLSELAFKQGELVSAHLGSGHRSIRYVARRHPPRGWRSRIGVAGHSGYGFTIPARDEAGFSALRELEDRGVNHIANALMQSCDHVMGFFGVLRSELAFYVGQLSLCDRLESIAAPICLPQLAATGERDLTACELYDVALALTLGRCPVTNDLGGAGTSLVMITGANQGGKSTLLRAIGQAQLMAQAGMIVGAGELRIDLRSGVFTHFKREEDESMRSGKLDEELSRMSAIADAIAPGGLLVCNESFSSTNEREGSQIARQIVRAMLDSGVKVAFVTHQYELAHGFWSSGGDHALFLRAGREEAGQRTYRLTPGEPLPTSYGQDSYRAVFGDGLPAPDRR